MRLYNYGLSPNALRVRSVANELGLALELVEVDIGDADAKRAALLEVNPNAKVPVLVDGDFALWESRAINAYLASKRPEAGLYPADPRRRAAVDQWSYWQAIHLGPAMQAVAFQRHVKGKLGLGAADEAAAESQLKETIRLLPMLDAALAGRDWVTGTFSIADFALATTFMYRDVVGISLAAVPNVAAWIARLEARPSWQAAVAPITEFILS